MGVLWGRFRALSMPVKIVLALAALGAGIVLSPLMVVLAGLALAACLLMLLVCVLTRRTASRAWSIASVASFVAILAFSGVSEALYGDSQPQPVAAPEVAEKETAEPRKEPKPQETMAEETPEPTREAAAAQPRPEPEPNPNRNRRSNPLHRRLRPRYSGRSTRPRP